MADLPDYYTQAQISEAEAASIKGGLGANRSLTPVSRDIYLGTDDHILYVCVVDGAWTGFDAVIITQGALAYARLDLTGKLVVADLTAALINAANGLVQLDAAALLPLAQLPAHGAAKHTDVTRELFLPANEGFASAGTPASRDFYGVVSGAANLYEPIVHFSMKVPDDFVSFTSVKAVFITLGTGNMYWTLNADYAADGEPRTTHTDLPAKAAKAVAATYTIYAQEPTNPLTLVNLAAGDYLGLSFDRQGSSALDTIDQVVNLLGLLFTYTANQ